MEKRQVIELTVKKMLCDQAQYFGTYHDIARKVSIPSNRVISSNHCT